MSTKGKVLLIILVIVVLGSAVYLGRGLLMGKWGVSADVPVTGEQALPLSTTYKLTKGANFISVPFTVSAGSLENLGKIYTLESGSWKDAKTLQPKPGLGYLAMADEDSSVNLDPNSQAEVATTEDISEIALPLSSAGWFCGGNPFAKAIPLYNTTEAVKTAAADLTPGLWLKFTDSQSATKYLSIGQAVKQGWVYGPYKYIPGSDYVYIPNSPTLEMTAKEGFLLYFVSLESTAGEKLQKTVYVSS